MSEITVIVLAGDDADLRATLDSVFDQRDVSVDVVVVHTAAGRAVLPDRFADRVRVVGTGDSRSAARGRKEAWLTSRSPFVLELDPGDRLLAGALRAMLDAAHTSPQVGFVHGWSFTVDARGAISRTAFRRQRQHVLAAPAGIVHATRLYRRSAVEPLGGLDEASDHIDIRPAEGCETRLVKQFVSARRGQADPTPTLASRRESRAGAGLARRAARAIYDRVRPRLAWWPLGGTRRQRRRGPENHRIAYHTWQFPVLSQTFVHREVAALVRAGIDLRVIAHASDGTDCLDSDARSLLSIARYLDPPDGPSLRRHMVRLAARHPIRFVNVVMFVLTRAHGPRKAPREDLEILRDVIRLAVALEREGAGHVHAAWADRSALTALLAARLLGLSYSLQARAHDVHRESYLTGLADKLAQADLVITNSAYNYAHLRAMLPPARSSTLVTVYNGLNLAQFTPEPAAHTPGTAFKLLAVGRLIEQKGFEDLLQACKILDAHGRDFTCDIVGGAETPLYTAFAVGLMERFEQLSLSGRVRFCGAESFDRVLERYRRADIFVLPCLIARDGSRDITPNAVIEAMAMKRPVVSTTVTALPEIVEHEVSGLLVPPNDAAAVARAIERLMDDPALRARLADNARARVESRFDVGRNVEQRVALFRRLLEEPARTGERP